MIFPTYYNNFPYSNRYRYTHYPKIPKPNIQLNSATSSSIINSTPVKSVPITNPKVEKETRDANDEPWFDLFGIKLYFDDILIICLLFFLYTEGVQDQSLFIALIMLLLS